MTATIERTFDVLPSLEGWQNVDNPSDGLMKLFEKLRAEGVSDVILSSKSGQKNRPRVACVKKGDFLLLDAIDAPFEAWEQCFNKDLERIGKGAAKRWDESHVVDYGVQLPSGGVARLHVWDFHGTHISARIHPARPKTLDELIPFDDERDVATKKFLRGLPHRRQGLVVIGGQVRSGKTWLENALYHELNQSPAKDEVRGRKHIWIIGDPVEFYHEDNYSLFTHIDIAERGTTQADEVRASLRVPRSLIAAGEQRGSPEATEAVIEAALSGSLAFSTGHFPSITEIVQRFSLGTAAMSEESKKKLFAESLQAIVNLRLVKGLSGDEILAVEYIDFRKKASLRGDLASGVLGLNDMSEMGEFWSMRYDLEYLNKKGRISDEAMSESLNDE